MAIIKIKFLLKKINNKGFALVFVLLFSVIIIAVLKEIMFESQLSVKSAINERNKIYAEMAMMSGKQFFDLLLTLDKEKRMALGLLSPQQRDGLLGGPLFDAHKAKGSDLLKNNAFSILDFPIGSDVFTGNILSSDSISSDQLKSMFEKTFTNISKAIKEDKELFDILNNIIGHFQITISYESRKFNLNFFSNASSESKRQQEILVAIFSGLKEELAFLEQKKIKNPLNLACYIIDYIDTNERAENCDGQPAGGNESSVYEEYKLPYGPKNAKLSNIEELKRIPGFQDDEVFNLFSKYFTAWPSNISGNADNSHLFNIFDAPFEIIMSILNSKGQKIPEQVREKTRLNINNTEKWPKGWNKQGTGIFNDFWNGIDDIYKTEEKVELFKALEVISTYTNYIYKVEIVGNYAGSERKLTYVIDTGERFVYKDRKDQSSKSAEQKYEIIYEKID